jgi:hypothetical protein
MHSRIYVTLDTKLVYDCERPLELRDGVLKRAPKSSCPNPKGKYKRHRLYLQELNADNLILLGKALKKLQDLEVAMPCYEAVITPKGVGLVANYGEKKDVWVL